MRNKNKRERPLSGAELGVGKSLREIMNAEFIFHKTLRVSKRSRYGDRIWTWVDPSNPRLQIYDNNRLTIDWKALQKDYELTAQIMTDLRKYAFLRLYYSREAFPGYHANKNAHPATLVNEIRNIINFLSHLRAMMSGDGYSLIDKLSDIEVEDISNALSTYPNKQFPNIKKVLKYLGSPFFGNLADYGPLKWNSQDIENLDWAIKKPEPYERLPDELFRFLSNSATSDVKQFLRALGIEPEDITPVGDGSNIFLDKLPNFHTFFEEYVIELPAFRRVRREREGGWAGESRYVMWSHSRPVGLLSDLVHRARKAAQLIIAMYTGARLSELNSFEVGCLRRDDDGWVICGTLIKGQDLDAPLAKDKWVAIPIIRDAVKVLEQTARLLEVKNLFHGMKLAERETRTQRPGSGTVSVWFEDYLKEVDVEKRWAGVGLNVHRFRHTLVFQLRRAGLNLPFITFQLKHRYDAMERRVARATLGYGSIDSDAAVKATQDARLELIRSVYHPDAPVAGGGAEQLKARRAAYFTGMALQGVEADEILNQLARSQFALTDVGGALCQGQRTIVLDGVKSDPPCIGQLRCNPLGCSNGIIPEYKKPHWRRIAEESRKRASDPELAHAKSYHEEAAQVAESVVRFFETSRSTDG